MSNVLGDLFRDIANAIRGKTGDTATMKPAEFPSKIAAIETGGGSVQTTEYLAETTFTNEYISDIGAFAYFVPLETATMEAWMANRKTVTVVYDGEELNLTPQVVTGMDGNDGVCIGNMTSFGGTGNGEPFAVVSWATDVGSGLLIGSTVDTAPTEHTIRIYQEASVSMDGVYTVTFMTEDGSAVLYERLVVDGDDCANVVDRGLLATPTKESTAQYNYTYSGWSLTSGGSANASALSSVTADRTVYAAFTSAVRYYTNTYYDSDGTTLLKTESLPYGAMPNYMPEKDGASFTGWNPALATVTGNASYTAAWEEKVTFAGGSWADIAAISESGQAADYFSIGDTRTEIIGGQSMTLMIVDFDADLLTDGGTAGLTIMVTDATKCKKVKTGANYRTTYVDCTMKQTTDSILSTMSGNLQSVVKSVVKKYSSTVDSYTEGTYNAKVWQPSFGELYDEEVNGCVIKERYLDRKYKAITDGKLTLRLDPLYAEEVNVGYWTRTKKTGEWQYYATFIRGGRDIGYYTNNHRLVFGFCI